MKRFKVLYAVKGGLPIHELMRSAIPPELELGTLNSSDRAGLLGQLQETDFLIGIPVDAEVIAAAPRLKLGRSTARSLAAASRCIPHQPPQLVIEQPSQLMRKNPKTPAPALPRLLLWPNHAHPSYCLIKQA